MAKTILAAASVSFLAAVLMSHVASTKAVASGGAMQAYAAEVETR
ncbi:hypothetical protein [Novosphingobium panipatense]|uniref:Uncharacterized protein n=1 Tax=Novosphingobium panipatense TaxID=428991 RepID=A0ABY1Q4R6_9SPHN|nr:hypothetical protein [Novosphingobium panipatense]SMP55767.1 hypothetical protein SAMN06296065_10234 [Novosphingobium panipatense]